MQLDTDQVEDIRRISRLLAREWGFMGGGFAGTDLSPSSVHALIELQRGCDTARELGTRLGLEKSSVSRMLRRLVDSGDVLETAGGDDGRLKLLSLTAAGMTRVAQIDEYARSQVGDALGRLSSQEASAVADGLRLYAKALGGEEGAPEVEIVAGYQTGLIASITDMHARYYARENGFGQKFESVVASGMADLCGRLGHPKNQIWSAVRNGEIVGSIAVDGEDIGHGIAHLRCFIIDDKARGTGAGRRLLATALAFIDGQDFCETHLWTFKGLLAARHLYESLGFVLVEERPGTQWGKEVMEQRFVRPKAD